MSSSDAPVAPVEEIVWHRAHPAYMLTALLRNLRGFIFPVIVLFLGRDAGQGGRTGSLVFFGISAIILLLSGIVGVIQWRVYRYALTPDRLLVHSGIVFRQERAIPYQRIQSVDLEQAPLDQLFGVSRMKVETAAGGAESDVELKAVKQADALALRDRLLSARRHAGEGTPVSGDVPAPVVATEGRLLHSLSFRDLLFAGATSGTIGPALAIIGVGMRFAEDIVPDSWWRRVPWEDVSDASTRFSVIAVVVLLVAVIAWLLAIGGTVLTWYGFELRRDDTHLIVQYGLLDRRRTTIPIGRIQAVRVEEPLLRQPFRLATLRYDSAGRAGSEEGGSGVLCPMMPRRDVEALLRIAAPEFAVETDHPRLERLPKRALSRYIVGKTGASLAAVGLAMAGVWWWRDGLPWWGYLALIWPVLEIVFGWLGWRDAGWRVQDGLLVLRARGLERSLVIAPLRRIQHRGTTANPFQRRGRLATLHIAVASGGLGGHYSLRHIDAETGIALLHALAPRRSRSG
ncbi:MAG TPA: PH domain-containing protein [Thermomicrobiales bacterium]|nr:PH domain-containing protein [Thermomicrobiales bacterium]